MVEEAPPVDWRKLRDGDTIAKPERKRPPFQERRSTSEGDMSRGSYRESVYDDHFTVASVNDDGTAIAGETNELLSVLILETRQVQYLLEKLLGEVVSVPREV